MQDIFSIISSEIGVSERQVSNTIALFDDGCTIPFISRYRKERTGGLDETQVEAIFKRYEYYKEVQGRKTSILGAIEKQGKLTPELKSEILATWNLNDLEDLYIPYKPKRRTRAAVARERGLEPLAKIIFAQKSVDVYAEARKYLTDEVKTVDDAIAGASDINAELISEDKSARERIRRQFAQEAIISSKVVKSKMEEAEKYRDYFDFSQRLSACPSHRILAMRRGEDEGFLRVDISPDEEHSLKQLKYLFVHGKGQCSDLLSDTISDAYSRLLKPSIETEFAASSKEKADVTAIEVFAANLRQLLMTPPLGKKRILGIDPGYRTGCKLVCIDTEGNLLHNDNIYPHKPQEQTALAMKKLSSMVSAYKIDAIAIGNGTASRETEYFVKRIHFDRPVQVFVVSEDGASVYSASSVAREEFPQYDVTVRGAVSIARRLMDPLAELVKIEPKSIGVGQYQHDVDQKLLKESLDRVVVSVVNNVGVNLNTATKHLLNYVSGLGPVLAQNIVDYRRDHGAFTNRRQLMEVTRLGSKAFEQCAGFLRIPDGDNPLDNTAVHPESYGIVAKIAKDCKVSVEKLVETPEILDDIDLSKYVTEQIGMPSLLDIVAELKKKGRNPRGQIKILEFDKGVHRIDDLEEGMVLPGIVTNITNFGAFVDFGIKENGLVHVSQISEKRIESPTDVLKLHQYVKVKIVSVDVERKRVQLTMKGVEQDF